MSASPNLVGKRFGRWLVVARSDERANRQVQWQCVCDCGTERLVITSSLTSGKSSSCGCIGRETIAARNFKHGHSMRGASTATYESWKHMRQRCENSACDDYPYYGGRGITVCDRWSDFSAFLEDMGEVPDGLTLERNDVNGDYEPGNCRWATRAEQTANRRPFYQEPLRGSRSPGAKLTDEDVVAIRGLSGVESQRSLGARFGVTQSNISMIMRGKTWADQ